MNIQKEHVRLPVSTSESVHIFIMTPERDIARDLVFVFSHGFTVDGTESARHFLLLAHELTRHGCSTILFDYRGSGYSDRAFEDMTLDTEIIDLHAVLDFTRSRFPHYDVAVWGESFGTAVIAHTLTSRTDVAFALMWSLSANLHGRYGAKFGADVKERGYALTPSGFKVKNDLLDSLRDRDTFSAIRETGIPCLLVHGDADRVAPIDLSRTAHRVAPHNTVLHEIRGGNHGFEAQPSQFAEALKVSIGWIRTQPSF